MKNIILILFVFFCLLSMACSKSNYGKKTVRNDSSQNLKIIRYKKLFPGEKIVETFSLQPQQEAIIEEMTGKGGPYYSGGSCGTGDLDSLAIEIAVNTTSKVAKDLNKSDSWSFSKRSRSNGIDTECRAIITDNDIVPK